MLHVNGSPKLRPDGQTIILASGDGLTHHPIVIESNPKQGVVRLGDKIIEDTTKALRLCGYSPCQIFAVQDELAAPGNDGQAGKVAPNIGSPLSDVSAVASS